MTELEPVADEPRYRPWKAVVASEGSVVLYLTVYVLPFTMPVAVNSARLLLTFAPKLYVTRLFPLESARV